MSQMDGNFFGDLLKFSASASQMIATASGHFSTIREKMSDEEKKVFDEKMKGLGTEKIREDLAKASSQLTDLMKNL